MSKIDLVVDSIDLQQLARKYSFHFPFVIFFSLPTLHPSCFFSLEIIAASSCEILLVPVGDLFAALKSHLDDFTSVFVQFTFHFVIVVND